MAYSVIPTFEDGDVVTAAQMNAIGDNDVYFKSTTDTQTTNIATNAAAILIPMKVQKDGGAVVGGRSKLNCITGTNSVLTVADNSGNDSIDVTFASSGGSTPTQAEASGVKTIVSAASAGSFGNYTQMFAACSFDTMELSLQLAAIGNTYSDTIYVNIGVGAPASEVVKIPSILFSTTASTTEYRIMQYSFPFHVDSGSRIAIQCANIQRATATYITASLILLG